MEGCGGGVVGCGGGIVVCGGVCVCMYERRVHDVTKTFCVCV